MPTAKKAGQYDLLKHSDMLAGSEHTHPEEQQRHETAATDEKIMATLILRRRPGSEPLKQIKDFQNEPASDRVHLSHQAFADAHGASAEDLNKVASFAKAQGLEVVETNAARRTVVVRGTEAQLNKTFAIELQHYDSPLGEYHGHEGPVKLPDDITQIVELVLGLDNRQVPAKHYTSDPPKTKSLTPQAVASLYHFPAGSGSGQTIGIYEMPTSEGNPGYAMADVQATMAAFGGSLTVPKPTDVSVDGQANSGVTDGETLLDITVSSAIANQASIAVYFTAGASIQNIIHCLQRMIHPGAGDPQPNVISISYGWSPDNDTQNITTAEYDQMSQLFQDAAHLGITVLVSSGDSGVQFESRTEAEASYPATDPWVIACGGTTIGNVEGENFTEYVWNDSWKGIGQSKQHGATGGGISALFQVPDYQSTVKLPDSLADKKPGRGIPDVAGNASPISGYPQSQNGQVGGGGGTSAVAPLYAGLIALINANLGSDVGFINPILYSLAGSAFRDIAGPPGPANNSYGTITGYPATPGWNACTGLGSINGSALQEGLMNALKKSSAAAAI
jgi:kumamolisin